MLWGNESARMKRRISSSNKSNATNREEHEKNNYYEISIIQIRGGAKFIIWEEGAKAENDRKTPPRSQGAPSGAPCEREAKKKNDGGHSAGRSMPPP